MARLAACRPSHHQADTIQEDIGGWWIQHKHPDRLTMLLLPAVGILCAEVIIMP